MNNFLLQAQDCTVMVVDIQQRLFDVMEEEFRTLFLRNGRILVEAARVLDMPLLVSEQYPRGLGGTVPEIAECLGDLPRYEKLHFSCYRDAAIRERIDSSGRRTILVAGMESHVCVFQTAIDLLMAGYRVVVASDAVCSRRRSDRIESLREMSRAGALVYSTEMIVFMLLEKAGTPQFKKLSPFFK